MLVVSSLVMEIDFAVLDYVVAPIIYVKGSVRPFVDVDWSIHAGGPVAVGAFGSNVNEVFLLRRKEAGLFVAEAKTEGAVAAKVVGHEKAAIFFGKDFRGNDFEATMLGLPGIQAGKYFAATVIG
tara:strand:- start:24 stop:398 length:375 start_codon:yes stop_codon:yes gene_type:complete